MSRMTTSTMTQTTDNEWVRIYSPAGELLKERYTWRAPQSRAKLVPGMTVLDWKQDTPEYKLVLFRDPLLSVKWEKISRHDFIEHLRQKGIIDITPA